MPTFRKLGATDPEEPALPTPDERAIEVWVGSQSLARARAYATPHGMTHLSRTGLTLKALCQGSLPHPYRLEVTLDPTGQIVAGHCTCPVDGPCKHLAALLLLWQSHPEAFSEVAALEDALARRSPAELIALIRQMVARYPDLAALLELPMPGGASGELVDPEHIRRQVTRALGGARHEWGASYALAETLWQLVSLGDEYAAAAAWPNAVTVYRVVAQETLAHYEMLYDEEGELLAPVEGCVRGLSHCLAQLQDEVAREGVLRALFDVFAWDTEYGGVAVGDEVPHAIMTQAREAERARVIDWLRTALASRTEEGASHTWRTRAYGSFLLALAGPTLDDEAFLRLCRETGHILDAVERLLALGRLAEATTELRQANGTLLLSLADRFVAHDHAPLAEQIVSARLAEEPQEWLAMWLKERARARGDLATALPLAEQLFWQRPSTSTYQELKALAEPLGQWAALRPTISAQLTAQARYALLTEIHLVEGEIDRALASLPQVKHGQGGYWDGPRLALRVARAAEATHPQQAIDLYLVQVQTLIKARGRNNYAAAATYLQRIREVYQVHLKAPEAWERCIGQLREAHRTLPALRDELRQAGL